jgi:hypothetical protein
MFEGLQILIGKEKKDMIIQQATKEGHLNTPKPVTTNPQFIPTDKSVLNLLPPQQRDKILDQCKDFLKILCLFFKVTQYSEAQKYQIIARILEGNLRKKPPIAAPNQIKPPSLPGQMSDMDKYVVFMEISKKFLGKSLAQELNREI